MLYTISISTNITLSHALLSNRKVLLLHACFLVIKDKIKTKEKSAKKQQQIFKIKVKSKEKNTIQLANKIKPDFSVFVCVCDIKNQIRKQILTMRLTLPCTLFSDWAARVVAEGGAVGGDIDYVVRGGAELKKKQIFIMQSQNA